MTEREQKISDIMTIAESQGYAQMDLFEMSRVINKISMNKGFESTDPVEKIALMHSELSEALEELRDFPREAWPEVMTILNYDAKGKPIGFAFEMADVIIRVLQWCGAANIPIRSAVAIKMAYNSQRERKHGRSF